VNKTIACIIKQVFFNSYFEQLNLTLHSESCKQLALLSSSAWWFLVQIFHKVVQQHVSGAMRSLVITSLQIYWWVCQWKNAEMWLRSDRVTVTSLVSSFFRTYCIWCCHQFVVYSCYDSTLHLLDKCKLIIKWPLTERPTQQTASLPVLRYHLHPPTPLMSNVGRTLQYTKGQVFKDSKTQHTATVSTHNQYQQDAIAEYLSLRRPRATCFWRFLALRLPTTATRSSTSTCRLHASSFLTLLYSKTHYKTQTSQHQQSCSYYNSHFPLPDLSTIAEFLHYRCPVNTPPTVLQHRRWLPLEIHRDGKIKVSYNPNLRFASQCNSIWLCKENVRTVK